VTRERFPESRGLAVTSSAWVLSPRVESERTGRSGTGKQAEEPDSGRATAYIPGTADVNP